MKVVSYHRSWPNFAEVFGLDVVGYVEPKPGIPPSPSHTLSLIQQMKRGNIKIMLVEPVLRSEDAKRDRARYRRERGRAAAIGRRREGDPRLHGAVRLRHQSAGRGHQDGPGAMAADLTVGQMFEFLAAPFVASLILTGIHAYLGVHVVERGVIFVDLSLAQIAALGGTIALLLPMSGGDPHAQWSTGSVCVYIRRRGDLRADPQPAGANPAGGDHRHHLCRRVCGGHPRDEPVDFTGRALKDMLVGNIIAVSWDEVYKTAALYGAVGLFHYIFRGPFLKISMKHDAAEASGLNVRLWDFCSTRRSASSSRRRSRLPACCWCSAT